MTGKAFELVERTHSIKSLSVELQRAQGGEAAGAANRGLFQRGSVRRAVSAQEKSVRARGGRGHQGLAVAIKLYPAGATTHSDAGVTDIRKTYPALESMQRAGLLLLVHGEVTDPAVDLFDREAVFID